MRANTGEPPSCGWLAAGLTHAPDPTRVPRIQHTITRTIPRLPPHSLVHLPTHPPTPPRNTHTHTCSPCRSNVHVTLVCPGPVATGSEATPRVVFGPTGRITQNSTGGSNRMRPERTAQLIAAAAAHGLDEVWIALHPVLAVGGSGSWQVQRQRGVQPGRPAGIAVIILILQMRSSSISSAAARSASLAGSQGDGGRARQHGCSLGGGGR